MIRGIRLTGRGALAVLSGTAASVFIESCGRVGCSPRPASRNLRTVGCGWRGSGLPGGPVRQPDHGEVSVRTGHRGAPHPSGPVPGVTVRTAAIKPPVIHRDRGFALDQQNPDSDRYPPLLTAEIGRRTGPAAAGPGAPGPPEHPVDHRADAGHRPRAAGFDSATAALAGPHSSSVRSRRIKHTELYRIPPVQVRGTRPPMAIDGVPSRRHALAISWRRRTVVPPCSTRELVSSGHGRLGRSGASVGGAIHTRITRAGGRSRNTLVGGHPVRRHLAGLPVPRRPRRARTGAASSGEAGQRGARCTRCPAA